ncbi:MAG: restriction endonuclease [Planctomycetes bacterium]|nr:restriction endonuclease [Planctomycetota bacterium]
MKSTLTTPRLCEEATAFAKRELSHGEAALFGVTDGKAVGTYLEQKFRRAVTAKYECAPASSAKGIDFPDLNVDIKVTSAKQPQSSCPFKSARQKVFGLGYSLLVFVYEKKDDARSRTATLNIVNVAFVDASATGDYTLTRRLAGMVRDGGNEEDIAAYLQDRALPADEVEIRRIARAVMKTPPKIGYLTISNALQWRLQYGHVIAEAGAVPEVQRLVP